MQPLINPDFLLTTATARELYHTYAEPMPIVDYHCHIDPREIYEDRHYENLTELWLGSDHYKWRALRAAGVEERLITGNASAYEKFEAWSAVVPKLIGNPLYHWAHLELQRYFGIFEPLSPKTCASIWARANDQLRSLGARKIIALSRVTALCTTDDPADDLRWHALLKADSSFETLVLPTFRPDRALHIQKPNFRDSIARLAAASGVSIDSIDDLKKALRLRAAFFAEMGCVTADQGLDAIVCAQDSARATVAFADAMRGQTPNAAGESAYKTELLLYLAQLYTEFGFVMQLHYGVMRDNNPIMFRAVGPDAGFDAMSGVAASGAALAKLLGTLEAHGTLSKTIVYSLNPNDNAQITSVLGCFQGGGVASRMQHGSAWWFNDTRRGMEEQLTNLAESSILPNFIGMLTDSRSFLSYARHEYFRRILCALIGGWVERGEYPRDLESLGEMVRDISYRNAVAYFGFPLRDTI